MGCHRVQTKAKKTGCHWFGHTALASEKGLSCLKSNHLECSADKGYKTLEKSIFFLPFSFWNKTKKNTAHSDHLLFRLDNKVHPFCPVTAFKNSPQIITCLTTWGDKANIIFISHCTKRKDPNRENKQEERVSTAFWVPYVLGSILIAVLPLLL